MAITVVVPPNSEGIFSVCIPMERDLCEHCGGTLGWQHKNGKYCKECTRRLDKMVAKQLSKTPIRQKSIDGTDPWDRIYEISAKFDNRNKIINRLKDAGLEILEE